jgi:hypothetical protein
VGLAKLQFVQQVVPPVTWHDIQKQEMAPDHPDLSAGVRAGQGDNRVGGGHQLGYPVTESERGNQVCPGGQLAQPPLVPAVAAGYGQNVHAGVGQRGHRPYQRTEPPAAVDD